MKRFMLLTCLVVLTVAARADNVSDARALYKQGQFAQAVEKYKLATKDRPDDPALYWNLGFAYRKLGRNSEAVRAFEKAGKLDPTHSFASGPGKYEQILASTRSKATGKKAVPIKPTESSVGSLPEAAALKRDAVYVQEPNWARVNTAYLKGLAGELKNSAGKPVLFLVTGSAYRGKQLSRYATAIYRAVGLADARLLVASRNGAVSVTGPTIAPIAAPAPPKATRAIRSGDVVGGLEQMARDTGK